MTYLYFEPLVCRDDTTRANPILVFVVKVLELGLALCALWSLAVMLYRHFHAVRWLVFGFDKLVEFERYVSCRWMPDVKGFEDCLVAILAVAIFFLAKWLLSGAWKLALALSKPTK